MSAVSPAIMLIQWVLDGTITPAQADAIGRALRFRKVGIKTSDLIADMYEVALQVCVPKLVDRLEPFLTKEETNDQEA